MIWWWSWLLTVIGCIGLWVAGSRKRWGWLIGVAAQVLWISYAIATEQYGFIVAALVYGTVYVRNFIAAGLLRCEVCGKTRPKDLYAITGWERHKFCRSPEFRSAVEE